MPEPVLRDLLGPGLRVVFCGTAAGAVSAARGLYYAGPGNKFWRTLHDVGLTDRLLTPEDYPLLPQFGIGLTDLSKHGSGPDSGLQRAMFDAAGLRNRIAAADPAFLAFNGKKAAQIFFDGCPVAYGLQADCVGRTRLFVLPSTSGAASGFWAPNKAAWADLATAVRAAA